jgi:hypothetical protein
MHTHTHISRFLAALSALIAPVVALAQSSQPGIKLLEPIGGVREIPVQGNAGLGVFGAYFNLIYPWVIGMGAGIAVLMAVIGGIQIIQSGADQNGVSEGKKRLLMSLGGLLLILASATILNALNPVFFQ